VGSRRDGVYWLLERDDDDLVGIKHNRRIESFVASDVQTLRLKTKDEDESHMSEPFVRVTVRGDSFMLYQIRKMIATAVAVALGHYPAELIPASLARPARVVTPIAPPTTLYLHEAEFVPFAKNKSQKSKASDDDDDDDGERKGNGATRHNTRDFVELETVNHRPDRLVPSSATRFAIERFREDTLDPALGPALASDEWDVFVSNLFRSRVWTRDGKGEKQSRSVAEVLAAFGPYAAERSARKRELREMDAVLEAKAGEGLET
jgi:tRNA pseudouridine38-40 synthase